MTAFRMYTTVIAFVVATPSCTQGGVPTGTLITPAYFQFETVIPPDDDPMGSGWRAVCIAASMSQGIAGGPMLTSGTVCKFEVGLPFRNHLGPIPEYQAQRIAADIANQVAYQILTTTQPVTGLICGRFIKEYGVRLRPAIVGSKVRTCTPGLLVVPYP